MTPCVFIDSFAAFFFSISSVSIYPPRWRIEMPSSSYTLGGDQYFFRCSCPSIFCGFCLFLWFVPFFLSPCLFPFPLLSVVVMFSCCFLSPPRLVLLVPTDRDFQKLGNHLSYTTHCLLFYQIQPTIY